MNEERNLGLGSGVAITVGLIVGTTCLLLLGQGIGLAGSAFVWSLFIVLFLNSLQAISFNELYGMMPNVDGGLGQYTLVGLGPLASIVSNITAYAITNLLALSVEMSVVGLILSGTFFPMIPAPVFGVGFLLILVIVNYMGIDIFSKVQNLVVSLLIGSVAIMGLLSFFKLGTGTIITAAEQTAPVVTGISGLLSLSALAFWLFIGIEFIIPVAKNIKNPKRNVPLAMILGITMLFIVQSIFGVGMTHYVTLEELASNPLPHMVFAQNLLGDYGAYWMGAVTILAGISTANTLLGSITRILSGMADTALVPKVFAKKNKKHVPVGGLVLFAIVDVFLLLSGFAASSSLANIILAAACFWLVSYILVNISVLVLRKRYPNMEGRNNKLVFWGIPQIVCIIGDVFMIWNIAEGDNRIFIYKIFFALLIPLVVYGVIWLKVIKKMPLFKSPNIDDVNRMAIDDYTIQNDKLVV